MHKLMDGFAAVGATNTINVPKEARKIGVRMQVTDNESNPAGGITAVSLVWQGLNTSVLIGTDSGLLTSPGMAEASSSTDSKVAFGAFGYRIDGANYTIAASTGGSAITAFGTIALSKFGGFLVQINAAGTVSMKAPSAAQSYATDALAAVAVNALEADGGNVKMGKVLIENDGTEWTAGTDDLNPGSDVTQAAFDDEPLGALDIDSYQFGVGDLTNKAAWWTIDNKGERHGRLYLKTLTGTGTVDAWVSFR